MNARRRDIDIKQLTPTELRRVLRLALHGLKPTSRDDLSDLERQNRLLDVILAIGRELRAPRGCRPGPRATR